MARALGLIVAAVLVLTAIGMTGCSHMDSGFGLGKLAHELKPHRMWRWNRQPDSNADRNYR